MLNTEKFGEALKDKGFNFFSGVPCSFLKDFINYAISRCNYIGAANEGEAVAIASGATLGGEKSVVLMQNSGLTNAVSPLMSLNYTFKLPVLGFVSFRGEEGLNDEPQHELTGKKTTELLELMKIKWEFLSDDLEEAVKQIEKANDYIEKKESFFFVVKKGCFGKFKLFPKKFQQNTKLHIIDKTGVDSLPSRFEALSVINQLKDKNTVQLATTGKTGRELFEIEDAPNNFYMVGSMGCISSIGLGLSLVKKQKNVIVIDGDGSLLMRMGSLATNGHYHPSNMIHILLDNGTHDSTGGQSTVSTSVNFLNTAASCGYKNVIYIHNLDELKKELTNWIENKRGLTFFHMKTSPGSKENLGRPKLKPHEVKERLEEFLKEK